MENSTKAIMIGVALFITISVVSAVMLITGIGTDAMNSSNQQLAGVASNVASQLLADYDAVEVTGATVIATIKKFYDKDNFLLAVDNQTNGFSQSWYSTKKKIGWKNMTTSIDGENFVSNFNKADNYTCVIIDKDAEIADNEPTITGLSTKITSTDKYMSYIIYWQGEDIMLGVYFKKIS